MSRIRSYLKYRLNAVNAHGIHSPFVFEFYNEVLKKAGTVDDAAIQKVRKELLRDRSVLKVEDHGAGSHHTKNTERSVASIAATAAIRKKYGRLLQRIAEFYKAEYVLELGTSLGLGTAYMGSAPSVKKVITIEGAPEIATAAKLNFDKLGRKTIEVKTGRFEDHLASSVAALPRIDIAFIDGNHRYQPTMNYFNAIIDKLDDHGFLIFDDIYWSDEMTKAWTELCASPKVNVSMDLFRLGIVCKRPKQARQHFILNY
jgi:predicted O-methyltransferase YrrM